MDGKQIRKYMELFGAVEEDLCDFLWPLEQQQWFWYNVARRGEKIEVDPIGEDEQK